MSYYDQSNSYSDAPSTYPGGPSPNQGGGARPTPPLYQNDSYNPNNQNQTGTSSSYYNSSYPYQGENRMAGPVQYDQRGYPIPSQQQQQGNNPPTTNEDRGLGTMALGAMGGVAANKMTGGNHSNLAYAAGGAVLAEGARMAFDMFEDRNRFGGRRHHHRGGFGGGGFGGGGFGGGGFGGGRGGGMRREERRILHDIERMVERR